MDRRNSEGTDVSASDAKLRRCWYCKTKQMTHFVRDRRRKTGNRFCSACMRLLAEQNNYDRYLFTEDEFHLLGFSGMGSGLSTSSSSSYSVLSFGFKKVAFGSSFFRIKL